MPTARMANFTCRCLDAAHGAGIGPIAGVQGTRLVKREPEDASAAIRGGKRGGSRVGASRTDVDQSSRHAVAVARSRRKKQSLGGMRRRGKQFRIHNAKCTIYHSERSNERSGRLRTMPSKEEKDKRSAVKNLSTYTFIQILRRSAPQNDNAVIPYWHRYGMSSKIPARAGCGGRAFSASRPPAQGLPYQKEPAGHACHNCHRRIYFGQGYRFFVALLLRMTNY